MDYDGIEGHHTCRIRGEENRSCCNPAHLTPATKPKHVAFHNRVGDSHPHNDATQTFQIVETKTLTKPESPNDNVIPFYKINRNNEVKFNTNLMIDCGNGVVRKASKLPPDQLHNFQEGFNPYRPTTF